MKKTAACKKVLILGGGFGGVYAGLTLEKGIAGDSDVEVVLVSKQNFFMFTPMLHEVAAGDLETTNILTPMRKLFKKVVFLEGDVKSIDLENRRVEVTHLAGVEKSVLTYDYLLLAMGSVPNFFNLPGIKEHALTMQSLSDAARLRNALIESLEEAEFDAVTHAQRPLLTYLVAGGGFAGVETVGAINDFVRQSVKSYPHLTEEMVRVVLVHDLKGILPELEPTLGEYARSMLTARGVEVILNTKVTGLTDRGVELSNGTAIKSVIVVWTAGITTNQLLKDLPVKVERGRLVVNEFLEVEGHADIWALGDCALVPDRTTGKPCPPTAQHASRQGVVCGRNITAAIRGLSKERFQYKMMGQLAAIGHQCGVAQIMGMKFSGFVGWILWRTVYLSKLPRFEKRLRVALDWTLDMLFGRDLISYVATPHALMQNDYQCENTAEGPDGYGYPLDAGDGCASAPPEIASVEVPAARTDRP